ncbi:protein O-glucosyltransferase 2-like [Aricia agestis]|uniref:protein O-glucosyltransferase 2-like n=1 Tax=Aricia agestis TaxID=91739 RepID=UPI001C203220|nr:protein O-glucosyltransferase 2-like [Aricia agestis]
MNLAAVFICFTGIVFKVSYASIIHVYGPGLRPKEIVMPARYFFINTSLTQEELYTNSQKNIAVEIFGTTKFKDRCRIWTNVLDRKDGSFIVRYKVYETCYKLLINIYFKNKHIEKSPFVFEGPIQGDQCNCPAPNMESWMLEYGCELSDSQINEDLKLFTESSMQDYVRKVVKKYHKPDSISFCHYVIQDNELFRDCYGKHVGFNMFADNIFLSILRRVKIADLQLVMNLGDWPLVKKTDEILPIFSWCGSNETFDIVLPTYDITESTLENMGRVTLDTLSVQGNIDKKWEDRESRAFWRGRDSRMERLKLIDIAKAHPELFNASLTNFFFFRDKESQYGPKVPHVSFYKFFDYKYQINIDGTVAAYRLAYLLAGGGLVFKQDSPYYEHFYRQLQPWEHYIPIKRDLSDLVERIKWARDNDDKAQRIAQNARQFANEHLLPQHVICYHALLLSEWSKKMHGEITPPEGMTHIPQPKSECDCKLKVSNHEEL